MKRTILVALCATTIASSHLVASEPSAFGAGNLDNPTPYGLTSSEKLVLENKDKLQKVLAKSSNQANEVDSLRERLDGLQSIIESLSLKAQNNKTEIYNLTNKSSDTLKNSDEFQKRLSSVAEQNSEEIAKIKLMITELSKSIDNINATYVTKDELKSVLEGMSKTQKSAPEQAKKSTSEKSQFDGMSNAEIAQNAQAFFDKKYYTNAIEHYTYLVEQNYKPAYANYMLGEMNFKRKKYADAIAYYKESTSLFTKASYMPNLLLHTAISMENSGDKKNAKAFYEGLISRYSDTPEAKEAKKNLKALK